MSPARPALSVIIPAMNEGAAIDACLSALAASEGVRLQVIVAANGCSDDTVARARAHGPALAEGGGALTVLDLPQAGKPGALNAGDGVAEHGLRVYLDADVTVTPPLMAALAAALETDAPRLASGRVRVAPASSAVTRAYARFWTRLPFLTQGVPAFGLYAVNAAGRARWGAFPPVIADDLFVRLSFAPSERIAVDAAYTWPLPEGFARLVRVRARQDRGVAEIARLYPRLPANEDPRQPAREWLPRLILRDPVGFAVYAAVRLAARLARARQSGWERGR